MPVTVSSTNRDTLAVEAIRTRLATVTGLWPIYEHNAPETTSTSIRSGYIVETPVGGPVVSTSIGGSAIVRSFTRQYQLLLHSPVNDGLSAIAQGAAIEAALLESPIWIDADAADGPIALMILDVSTRPTREPSGNLAYWTTPVVVQYRFYS